MKTTLGNDSGHNSPLNGVLDKNIEKTLVNKNNFEVVRAFFPVLFIIDLAAYLCVIAKPPQVSPSQFSLFTLSTPLYLIAIGLLYVLYTKLDYTKIDWVTYPFTLLVIGYRLIVLVTLGKDTLVLVAYMGLYGMLTSAFFFKYELIVTIVITQALLGFYLHTKGLNIDATSFINADFWDRFNLMFISTFMLFSMAHISSKHRKNYLNLFSFKEIASKQNHMLFDLINELDEIVVILDANHRIVQANHMLNKLTNLPDTPTEAVLSHVLGKDSFQRLKESVTEVIKTGEKKVLKEIHFRHTNSQTLIFNVTLHPFTIQDQVHALLVASNITQESHLSKVKDIVIKLNNMLSSSHDFSDYLDLILKSLIETMPYADLGSVLIADDQGVLRIASSVGYPPNFISNFYIHIHETFYSRVNKNNLRMPIIINDIAEFDMDGYTMLLENNRGIRVNSSLSCPIFLNDQLHGLINLDSAENRVFSEFDLEVMTFIMEQVSVVLNAHYLQEQTMYLSRFDQLTGLYNRWYLQDIETTIIPYCLRHQQTFVLALMDLNDLKFVNDHYGHPVGDLYLQYTANLLKNKSRDTDVIVRIGGDEFLALYYNTTPEKCMHILDQVNMELKQIMFTEGVVENKCHISYGLTCFATDSIQLDILMRLADTRMYQHKLESKKRDFK